MFGRHNLFAEAFEVAQDIEDYDLFMDLFNVTKFDPNLVDFSAACFSQAAAILHEEDMANGNISASDFRSESVCSQSTSSDTTTSRSKLQQQQQQHQKFLKHYVPPLPSFKSKVYNAEMIKINIPKPELRSETVELTQQQERTRPPPPPVPDKKQTKLNPTTLSAAKTAALSSNLANLSLKSGRNHASQTTANSNDLITTGVPQWSDLSVSLKNPSLKSAFTPFYNANNTHFYKANAPPLAITTNNNNHTNTISSSPASSYIQHNTPMSIIQDTTTTNNIPVPQQRSYVASTAIPQSVLPVGSMYQPKFFQHPLVSGTIPSSGGTTSLAAHSISNEEYQKVLLSKKPTASILSNGSATQNAGSNTSVLSGHSSGQNGLKESNKTTNGEKNKVKFSDTVQVAVVPVSKQFRVMF